MIEGEKPEHEFRPQRTENILNDDLASRPEVEPTPSSSTGTATVAGNDDGSIDKEAEAERRDVVGILQRTSTTRTQARERIFEPIHSGDRAQLTRLASNFSTRSGGGSSLSHTSTRRSGLARRDTLYGVNVGDAVLDPQSPDFDPYKWSRM